MNGISRVVPFLVGVAKVREIRCEGVPVEEDDVVGVNGPNGWEDSVVKIDDPSLVWVSGLIECVVPSNPFVSLVVLCELLPQPNSAVLEILVIPD